MLLRAPLNGDTFAIHILAEFGMKEIIGILAKKYKVDLTVVTLQSELNIWEIASINGFSNLFDNIKDQIIK